MEVLADDHSIHHYFPVEAASDLVGCYFVEGEVEGWVCSATFASSALTTFSLIPSIRDLGFLTLTQTRQECKLVFFEFFGIVETLNEERPRTLVSIGEPEDPAVEGLSGVEARNYAILKVVRVCIHSFFNLFSGDCSP